MCFSKGYKSWFDMNRKYVFPLSAAEKSTSKEVSHKTLEILLNRCLYPGEPIQTATVRSL